MKCSALGKDMTHGLFSRGAGEYLLPFYNRAHSDVK